MFDDRCLDEKYPLFTYRVVRKFILFARFGGELRYLTFAYVRQMRANVPCSLGWVSYAWASDPEKAR